MTQTPAERRVTPPERTVTQTPPERRAEATKDRIQQAAVELFLAKGYEHTSVADVADAADISERTFFRYFHAKEDILFRRPESYIPRAQAVIAALEQDVSDWHALQIALADVASYMQDNATRIRTHSKLMITVPELRAREIVMEHRWSDALARALAQRHDLAEPSFDQQVLAAAAVAAFGAAVKRWVRDRRLKMTEVAAEGLRHLEAVTPTGR